MARCSVVIVVGAWFGALIAVVDCVVDGRWDFGWLVRGFAIGAAVMLWPLGAEPVCDADLKPAANEPTPAPSDPVMSEEATGRTEM